MGIHLGLDILPLEIGPGKWHAFYDEALELARAFPLPLQRFDAEERSGYYRLLLTRRLESRDENGRFFAVTGDARTGERAEQFTVYRDIAFYWRKIANRTGRRDGSPSILQPDEERVSVFYEKTQSCPYHDLIWCIVTLAENFFPGRACATGDLNARDWAHCLQWLSEIKGKPFHKPLRLDAERLWDVLARRYGRLELVRKTTEELRGGRAAIYRLLAAKDAALLNAWAKNRLKENDPGTMGALGECLHILDGTGSLYALVRMACLDPDGPRWTLEQVLSIAHALGAFDPEPAGPVRAAGFLPAGFLPSYYRTGACFGKEEACREIAGMAGIPVEKVLGILQKLQAECHPPAAPRKTRHNKDNNGRTSRPLTIPYPRQHVDFFRQETARRGKNWDAPTLHGLIAPVAAEKHILLTEETWQAIDQEQDPAALAFVLGMMAGCRGQAGEQAGLEFAFSHLAEMREAWVSGQDWVCPVDELTSDEGVWSVQPQTPAE